MLEISCGTILFTIKNNEILYLLIKDNKGICGFPKGHTESKETYVQTALRETWEETSIRPELVKGFRTQIRYRLENGDDKICIFYLGDFSNQIPKCNETFEQFDFLILPFLEAYEMLSFHNTKLLLKQANEYLKNNM